MGIFNNRPFMHIPSLDLPRDGSRRSRPIDTKPRSSVGNPPRRTLLTRVAEELGDPGIGEVGQRGSATKSISREAAAISDPPEVGPRKRNKATILTARLDDAGFRNLQRLDARTTGSSDSNGERLMQARGPTGGRAAQASNRASLAQIATKQKDPWPASPVDKKFRDEIHKRESRKNNKNYKAKNPGIAWGRYQMTKVALQDLGLMDANGNWTGRTYGIRNENQFLNNPQAQEKVFAEYMKRNRAQLRVNGAVSDIGQKINGVKARITITADGLLAAAHRQGAGMVKQYLDHQRRHNWTSNPNTFPKNRKAAFLSIETRLREFQNIRVFKTKP